MLCIIVTGSKTTYPFPKSHILSQNTFQKPNRSIFFIFTLFLMSVLLGVAVCFVAKKKNDPYIQWNFHFSVYFLPFVLCWVEELFVGFLFVS